MLIIYHSYLVSLSPLTAFQRLLQSHRCTEPDVAAIKEVLTRGQLGAFFLQDENTDPDLIIDVNSVHLGAPCRRIRGCRAERALWCSGGVLGGGATSRIEGFE